uniref:fructokinase n=1 Tax=Caulobacter sp. (strain K31) TaxID=366602 RepID=B0SW98_CAUSK
MASRSLFAGVELGGTKSIAVLAEGRQILEREVVATTTPDATLAALALTLERWGREHPVAGLGIASFGPIQLDAAAQDHGHMLATPKPGWSHAPVAPVLTRAFRGPWAIDTDVNGAALAEYDWGAGEGCRSLWYLTLGTGVGGGLVIDGRAVHGAMHPEIGHLKLRRAPGDVFAGACPFHGDCVEGLISGPALAALFEGDPAQVGDEDPRWAYVIHTLAELVGALLLTTSADRILMGGGIAIARPGLLPRVRAQVLDRQGSYLPFVTPLSVDQIITAPALGADAGPLGAIALAIRAADQTSV